MKNKFQKLNELYSSYQGDHKSISKMVDYLLDYDKFNLQTDGLEILKSYIFIDEIRENKAGEIVRFIEELQDTFNKEQIKNALIEAINSVSPEKSCYNLFYLFNQQFKHNEGNPVFTKSEFQKICETRLKNYTQNVADTDMPTAYEHLYSCWDFVDENNEVHLTDNALKIMYAYVSKFPVEFLKFTIRRRLMSGKSLYSQKEHDFVFEPFTDAIFGSWDKFEEFLKEEKKTIDDEQLISTIIAFYNDFKQHNFKYFTLKSSELHKYTHIPEINKIIQEQKETT